jgi:putative ABC transport system ATP-binding protein
MKTIEIKGLKKVYANTKVKTTALGGADLTIEPGEFVAIMGASGSGKSTLMHIIGLLDHRFEGKYTLDGQDVSQLSSDKAAELRNAKIGFVFQQFNLLKRSTVLQNVLLPTIYNPTPDDERRAIETIKQVGLADRIDYRSNELSGGQIQRVAIARALMMKPSLLLADEPTGNLDSQTSHEIMEIFRSINRTGTTIVLITHEDEIAAYAKRIIRMKDGLIVTDERKK